MPQLIIDTLELPPLTMPVATITLGWPDEQPAQSDRLPYRSYTPQRIDAIYGEKEALPENKEFVRINHKETLAQVFTDCRYTKRDNESMSKGLIETLKRQGFL